MNIKRIALVLVFGAATLTGVAAYRGSQERTDLPQLPAVAAETSVQLIWAKPFRLDEPYTHTWRAELPQVSAGWLVVLETDPTLLTPRQTQEPVLYVGEQTAERVNRGDVSGRLVAFVPSAVDADGHLTLDLERAPIWFGTPELPERVDAAKIREERALARRAGVRAQPEARVRAAFDRAQADETAFLPDRVALEHMAADLIAEHAPTETDLVEGLTAPLVR
jgi:hypothetical protein